MAANIRLAGIRTKTTSITVRQYRPTQHPMVDYNSPPPVEDTFVLEEIIYRLGDRVELVRPLADLNGLPVGIVGVIAWISSYGDAPQPISVKWLSDSGVGMSVRVDAADIRHFRNGIRRLLDML